MIIKRIFIILALLVLFILSPKTVNAQVLFSDDFNDGDSNGWTIPRNECSSAWQTNNNQYGIIISSACVTESIPSNLIIDSNINYSFEVDMLMSQSVDMDRNFVFKYKDSSNWYGIHTIGNNVYLHKVVNGTEYFLENWHTGYNFQPDTTYHFKVEVLDNSFIVYINGALQVIVPNEGISFNNKSAGLQASAGGSPNSEVWFDNVVVTELPPTATTTPTATSVPTSAPTATPTISPTEMPTATAVPTEAPTNTPAPVATATATSIPSSTPITLLNVPSLKQYSLPWKNKIYAFTKSTIQQFGCALTSASMVLKYHGHNIMPDGLNDWLKSQTDGYIRNGLVNWIAVSRYTKLHDSLLSPTLEYKRLSPTITNLDNELNSNRPAILKENGHFVVATGKTDTSYLINDPGYQNRNDLTSYGNSFLSINSYIPSHSDLSYMMFITEPNIILELKNSSGSGIPIDSYIEDPINDLLNQNKKSGNPVKITLLPKPENGKYTLKITGPKGKYQLDSYLYDTNGKVTKNNIDGKLNGNDADSFNITFEGKKRINEKDIRKSDFKFWLKELFKFLNFWH